MMTKRIYKSLLTAAMVAALSFGLASCTDKIDNSTGLSDNPQEQQAADAQQEKAQKYWSVVSHLVDLDDYTVDYEDKIFEPVYGVALGTAAGTRYVYTNTLASAAKRFADLVERDDIDENTETYTYTDPDIGTLIYKKGKGRELATVDVDIKQIPGLKKIVYVPGAYSNGNFSGHAYYRFGDVVSREVQGYDGTVTEYWICVRPSFGLEGKGDSHWVCLNVLPKKNVWYYHSDTNGKDYYLPTGLGTNQEQMQNLAELLYAIYDPDTWQQNVVDYGIRDGKLRMFHDFHPDKVNYHNKEFWRNVRRQWASKDILPKAFNTELETALEMMSDNEGLHLLYSGYSWLKSFSWNCTLNEAVFKNGTKAEEQNMHKVTYKSVTKDMRNFGIDFRRMGAYYYDNYGPFFSSDDDPDDDEGDDIIRWTVRHATGKELSSDGSYDKKAQIKGVTDVYRYYRDVAPNVDDDVTEITVVQETAANAPADGKGTYLPGDVVADQYGNHWFCLTGSPYAPNLWPDVTDHTAWFLSLNFEDIDTKDDYTVGGLPTEDELPELAYRLGLILALYNGTNNDLSFKFNPNESLGTIFQHIKDYAGVDWHKLIAPRDSVFTFTSKGRTYNSRSSEAAFCLAYNDGTGRQAIARLIIDCTQAGTDRRHCEAYDADGKSIGKMEDVRILLYKHYETYSPGQMRQPTAVEASLGVNTWCLPWQVTSQKMYLGDVTDQALVSRHAKDDKWVTLPQTGDPTGARRQPRTMPEPASRPRDYIRNYNQPLDRQRLSMFNEPMLFLRVMKVTDTGAPKPNLTSQDGRQLSVVHLLDNKYLYDNFHQSTWLLTYMTYSRDQFLIDNEPTQLQLIPGLPI